MIDLKNYGIFLYILFFVLFLMVSHKSSVFSSEEMIFIPGGEFLMGSPEGEGKSQEWPQHTVYVSDFYIDKYEVTNEEYAEFLNSVEKPDVANWIKLDDERSGILFTDNIYRPKDGMENYPAAGISWYGANIYAGWKGLRLPTEAEWEKACRGEDGRLYPWGMEWDPEKCANSSEGGCRKIMPAGSFPEGASPYGVMDMAGNVWEWCSDWYDKGYYKESPCSDPSGPSEGKYKVMRGGSWFYSSPSKFRCALRDGRTLKCNFFNTGFRCAKSAENN